MRGRILIGGGEMGYWLSSGDGNRTGQKMGVKGKTARWRVT